MRKANKILSFLFCFLLIFEQSGFAQVAGSLDISGYLSGLRNSFIQDKFRPLHLRFLSYEVQANKFNLLLDKGDLKNVKKQELQDTTKNLLNYFFIGITLPNDAFWVNLRPDAENNIIDNELARTDVGRILLEADLQLKKDTAKFTSPETPEGKAYWDKLYQKAGEIFGSSDITIPTLTRPWIVPDEIIIRETQSNAYIYKATLKVMLEQDYLKDSSMYNFKDDRLKQLNEYSSQLIREEILPKLTKEINTSKRYSPLRQVYYSLILAQWFKARFYGKGGLYSWLINRRDLTGLESKASWSKTTYFKAYQKSFKDGEYNIQQPVYTPYGQTIRSYFSGGFVCNVPIPTSLPQPGVPSQKTDGPTTVTAISGDTKHTPLSGQDRVIGVKADGGSVGNPTVANIEIVEEAPSPSRLPAEGPATTGASSTTLSQGRIDRFSYHPDMANEGQILFELANNPNISPGRRVALLNKLNDIWMIENRNALGNSFNDDFVIAGDNLGGVDRNAHEDYHRQGEFAEVISNIAGEIRAPRRSNGRFDLRYVVENSPGKRITTSHGEIYITEDGILVIIDSRFQNDHAGRGERAVYARSKVKAQHELAELKGWIEFAVKKSLTTEEELLNGQADLGQILRNYMNGIGENLTPEQLASRRQEVFQQRDRLHQQGLEAERGTTGTASRENKFAIIIYADKSTDWNGALNGLLELREELEGRGYTVRNTRVDSVDSLIERVESYSTERAPDLLVIGAHGTQESMLLGNSSDGHLTLKNVEKLRRIRNRLADGGTIVLQSCSTARGEGFDDNMANAFSEIFPQAEHVFAPRVPAGPRFIFDTNNQVSGIKYDNHEGAGVVTSVNLRTHETNLTERGYDAVAGKKIAQQVIETIDQADMDFIISSNGASSASSLFSTEKIKVAEDLFIIPNSVMQAFAIFDRLRTKASNDIDVIKRLIEQDGVIEGLVKVNFPVATASKYRERQWSNEAGASLIADIIVRVRQITNSQSLNEADRSVYELIQRDRQSFIQGLAGMLNTRTHINIHPFKVRMADGASPGRSQIEILLGRILAHERFHMCFNEENVYDYWQAVDKIVAAFSEDADFKIFYDVLIKLYGHAMDAHGHLLITEEFWTQLYFNSRPEKTHQEKMARLRERIYKHFQGVIDGQSILTIMDTLNKQWEIAVKEGRDDVSALVSIGAITDNGLEFISNARGNVDEQVISSPSTEAAVAISPEVIKKGEKFIQNILQEPAFNFSAQETALLRELGDTIAVIVGGPVFLSHQQRNAPLPAEFGRSIINLGRRLNLNLEQTNELLNTTINKILAGIPQNPDLQHKFQLGFAHAIARYYHQHYFVPLGSGKAPIAEGFFNFPLNESMVNSGRVALLGAGLEGMHWITVVRNGNHIVLVDNNSFVTAVLDEFKRLSSKQNVDVVEADITDSDFSHSVSQKLDLIVVSRTLHELGRTVSGAIEEGTNKESEIPLYSETAVSARGRLFTNLSQLLASSGRAIIVEASRDNEWNSKNIIDEINSNGKLSVIESRDSVDNGTRNIHIAVKAASSSPTTSASTATGRPEAWLGGTVLFSSYLTAEQIRSLEAYARVATDTARVKARSADPHSLTVERFPGQRWQFYASPFDAVERTFSKYLEISLFEQIVQLAKSRKDRPVYVLDWGCGDLTTAIELAEKLNSRLGPNNNVRIIAFGDTYYKTNIDRLPSNVVYVVDVAQNLPEAIKSIIGEDKIDLIFSLESMHFFLADRGQEAFLQNLKELTHYLSDESIMAIHLHKIPGKTIEETMEVMRIFHAAVEQETPNKYTLITKDDRYENGYALFKSSNNKDAVNYSKDARLASDNKASSSSVNPSLPPTTDRNFGGIDFRALPIVNQQINMGMLKLNAADLSRLNNINLGLEWAEIQNMVNAGIIPSNERIKEYMLASCLRQSLGNQMDKVLGCIADIMRMEEDRVSDADTELKDMLVLIEAGKPETELQCGLSQIKISPQEPQLITP